MTDHGGARGPYLASLRRIIEALVVARGPSPAGPPRRRLPERAGTIDQCRLEI